MTLTEEYDAHLQTSEPVVEFHVSTVMFPGDWVVRQDSARDLVMDQDYQRETVWGVAQQRNLIRSLLRGLPIPALTINDRFKGGFKDDYGYAVIDGKQRATALIAWFKNELDVPASWFPSQELEGTHSTPDGEYVYFKDLSKKYQRRFTMEPIPVTLAQLPTVEAEAELFVILNTAGTSMTHAAITNAARIAGIDITQTLGERA